MQEILWTVSGDQSFDHSFFDCSDWNNHIETVLHIWLIPVWPPPLPLFPQVFLCWLFLECGSFILSVLFPHPSGEIPQLDAQDGVE